VGEREAVIGFTMKIRLARSPLYLALFAVVIAPLAAALDPSLSVSQYDRTSWQREEGLPSNEVRALAQAPDGQLLIGTASGLVEFDGTHFRPMRVDSSDADSSYAIGSLLTARDGTVWIGTEFDGLFARRGSEVKHFTTADGLPRDSIQSLYEDDRGAIWVGTGNGTCRVTAGKLQCLSLEASQLVMRIWRGFVDDNEGGVLIAGRGGLLRWKNGELSRLRVIGLDPAEIRTLFRGSDRSLWLGATSGLYRLSLRSDTVTCVRQAAVLGPVVGFAEDQSGNLWISSFGHGVYRENAGGIEHWTSPSDNYIRALLVDNEGNLWLGCRSAGVMRWSSGSFIPYGVPEGLSNAFASVVYQDASGNLWLGANDGGLFRLQNGKITAQGIPSEMVHRTIRTITSGADGDTWFGTANSGIYRLKSGNLQHWTPGSALPKTVIRALVEDSNHNLWVGLFPGGVLRFRDESITTDAEQEFLPGEAVYSLLEVAPGVVLVGTWDGLYRISRDATEKISGAGAVMSLSKDSAGDVWVGLQSNGLDLYRNGRLYHYSPAQGLPPAAVDAVLDDRNGSLWIATDRGIIQVNREQMLEVADEKQAFVESAQYGKLDGMRSTECRGEVQPAAWRASNGDLWFATANSFVRGTTLALSDSMPPRALIESVTIDGREAANLSQLKLPAGTAKLDISFGSTWLTNPQQLQFRYRLVGFDRDWHLAVSTGVARYTALPPSHYDFQVEVRRGIGPWSNQSTDLAVWQESFLYQMWWFRALVVLTGMALLWFWTLWYRRRWRGKLAAVVEERNRISREWHDSLMAGFAAIAWQLEDARDQLSGAPDEARASMDLARDMVRHTQAEARRIIWDLRLNLDEEISLQTALSELCQRLSTSAHVDVRTELEGRETPLSDVLKHNLLRIAQESLHNAVQHARPESILVRLRYDADAVTLRIKDDGCGFAGDGERAVEHGHLGIAGMEERARRLGGKLDICSSPGAGTEVVATFLYRYAGKEPHA
jgi:signal transduction histidine kinase/ligand-binding sensor domain-containing protein